MFKVRSALESHLQIKHGDKQPVNIDQIPNTDGFTTSPITYLNNDFSAFMEQSMQTSMHQLTFQSNNEMDLTKNYNNIHDSEDEDYDAISFSAESSDSSERRSSATKNDFDNADTRDNDDDDVIIVPNDILLPDVKRKGHSNLNEAQNAVTNVQGKVLEWLYRDQILPNFLECASIGRAIGLSPNAVQVRAKITHHNRIKIKLKPTKSYYFIYLTIWNQACFFVL